MLETSVIVELVSTSVGVEVAVPSVNVLDTSTEEELVKIPAELEEGKTPEDPLPLGKNVVSEVVNVEVAVRVTDVVLASSVEELEPTLADVDVGTIFEVVSAVDEREKLDTLLADEDDRTALDEVVIGNDAVVDSKPMQLQADDTADGELLHWETYAGRPVDAVFTVVVYVAQNCAATDPEWIICRRQLFLLHFSGFVVVVEGDEVIGEDVLELVVDATIPPLDEELGVMPGEVYNGGAEVALVKPPSLSEEEESETIDDSELVDEGSSEVEVSAGSVTRDETAVGELGDGKIDGTAIFLVSRCSLCLYVSLTTIWISRNKSSVRSGCRQDCWSRANAAVLISSETRFLFVDIVRARKVGDVLNLVVLWLEPIRKSVNGWNQCQKD